jgi:hypothetical protein
VIDYNLHEGIDDQGRLIGFPPTPHTAREKKSRCAEHWYSSGRGQMILEKFGLDLIEEVFAG